MLSPAQSLLVNFGRQFNIRDFVETGTQAGTTFRIVAEYFDRGFTIDIDAPPSHISKGLFYFKGSSGELLANILQEYKITRALFWLDAHGNRTFYTDDGNDQIPKELDAIAKYAPDSLVVVDDITFRDGCYWVNESYRFCPDGWQVIYGLSKRVAVLHRGGYNVESL